MKQKCLFLMVLLNIINNLEAFRRFYVDGVNTIMAMERENITIECKSDMPMSYCVFVDPIGKRYSFSDRTLDDGKCSKKIQVSTNNSGLWHCHIGGKDAIGVEVIEGINVRVVQQLTAVKNISTVHGKQVTLHCVTAMGRLPLRYCRFEPPQGKPFGINRRVMANDSILDRYYFPTNMSLDRGDCAVTLRRVKYKDVGAWGCGAGFDDGQEYGDTIMVHVEGFNTLSTASVTGITLGTIVAAIAFSIIGFKGWKKWEQMRSRDVDIQMVEIPPPVEIEGSAA